VAPLHGLLKKEHLCIDQAISAHTEHRNNLKTLEGDSLFNAVLHAPYTRQVTFWNCNTDGQLVKALDPMRTALQKARYIHQTQQTYAPTGRILPTRTQPNLHSLSCRGAYPPSLELIHQPCTPDHPRMYYFWTRL
jgi:hypothetical protein